MKYSTNINSTGSMHSALAENVVATDVLVFKTNIRFKKDVQKIAPLFDTHPQIIRWNIDRADIDKVVRIESRRIIPAEIIGLLSQAGYSCEELPD